MYKEIVYEIFLFVIVILKFVFMFITILYRSSSALNLNQDIITFLETMQDKLYRVVDILINILLIVLFNPSNKAVRINDEEQFLLLVYGVLGLVEYFLKIYLNE